jgi:putative FmdB family regulatory protein
MPIYEYECESCGRFEVTQRITEDALKTCSKCGKPVHRLVSATSFCLKGGGWYKDLYGSSKSGGGNKAA